MRIYISIIILFMLGGNAYSQNFQRNYKLRNFEQAVNIAGLQLNDMSYVSMDGVLADSTIRNVLITHYDIKGTITWSRQLFMDDSDSIQVVLTGGSMIQAENDSLYFAFTLFRGTDLNKFVGSMDVDGNAGWSRLINENSAVDQTEAGFNLITNYIDSSFLQIASLGEEDNSTLVMNQIGFDGTLRRSSQLNASFNGASITSFVGDITAKRDSSIMIVGALNNTATYTLNVLDKNWNPVISKTFGDNVNSFSVYVGLDVKETPDTGYIVTGQFLNIVTLDSVYFGSFISKHDSLGDIVWSKRLNMDEMANITNGVVVNQDGSIMVAATVMDNDMTNSLICKLDENGDQQWIKLYNMVNVPILAFGDFQATQDGGYAFFTTAIVNDTIAAMNLIKTDAEGSTTCEDTLTKEIFEDIPILGVDYELLLVDNEDLTLDDYGFRADDFSSFAVVDLSLASETFCPNEQIDFLLDANVDGATGYLWSTGETTDTLRIFDDEEYSVIVTIGEEVCFTLCDTISMNRFDLPMVGGTYTCDAGEYNLFVSPVASAGVDSIIWSTGEKNVNQIRVTEQGSYSVTVTDMCGETAETTITVDPPQPIFTPLYICKDDGIFLLSEFDPAQTLNIQWSTGADDDGKHSVLITDPGVYTVTLTDICDETVIREINFDPPTPIVSGNGICQPEGIMITANVSNNTGILDIMWSTGAQDDDKETITVPSIGTYMVTVTDFCRQTASATVNFNPPPVQINPTLGDCNPDGQVVNSNIPTNQFSNIQWSTGSQDDGRSSIRISTPGEYSVTLTDLCLLTSTANFTIPVLPDMLTITPDFFTACNNGSVTLTAEANGDVDYAWSTGDSMSVARVILPGTYSVTATDGCMNQLIESITFNEGDLPLEVEQLTIGQDNSEYCTTNMVTLNAQIVGSTTGIEWSTGQTDGEIVVPANGQEITLTAFDECGNETTSSIITVPGDSTLLFPKIFFPSDNQLVNPENAQFGGYVDQVTDTLGYELDYDAISNFELHIFNRWGQEVFMSNDVRDRWNGLIDNDTDTPALQDVYIWWAVWRNEAGCDVERKGDVTLFR